MTLRGFCLLVLFGCAAAGPASAEKMITMGTGGVTGVYYPAGGAVCRLVNRDRAEHGLRCVVESTGGSIHNLEWLRKREIQAGIVQSDLLYHAYRGDEAFLEVGADKDLRVLLALHPEPFTIVAREGAKIRVLDDLKGKRVYLGPAGSGMRATMEELMRAKGWSDKSFVDITDLHQADQAQALCSGKVDAVVYAGGHPNGVIQQLTSRCPTRLVDISGPAVDEMIQRYPFFSPAVIPAGVYKGNDRDVRTFGVTAILVATADMSNGDAAAIVKSVLGHLDDFKTMHPVFAGLNAASMAADQGITPTHSGAAEYLRASGLRRAAE